MANLIMPLQIERQYGASLDSDYAFDTLDELKNYATTSALSYSGQVLYCKADDTLYKVNSDKTEVIPIGSSIHTHKASEIKFTKLDGTTTTVQDALGGGEFTPIIINKPASFKPYEYNLIAEIQLPDNYMTHHNLSFMCLNNRPQIANTFDRDADIYRFDLHMGTPMENAYTSEPKLRFYGFDLYEYPTADSSVDGINLYKDLAKCIKGYYDVANRKIYIFLIGTDGNYFKGDLGTTKIEYTGNGTITNSFQVSNFWDSQYAKWTQVCKLEDLESPTIFKLGGDSSENSKTYTTLDELGLTADATVEDVIGALKEGETAIVDISEFTNYLTMFPNYCTNDQYAILQVEKKNDNRAFIEWRQKEGNAYAIGGLNSSNKFTNWNNLVRFKKDGFADDSIVCIGNTVSSDGVIQTLENLGFSNDILTWDTGVYRVSHVSGLTGLPSEITNTSPAFRLEHHNIKKWGSNHNPNTQTWAQRHSIIYCDNGSVYQRFYESGATAGVYVNDTGWQKICVETESKKEEDNYIPNVYDRNANGDMPVVPFDRLANCIAVRSNRGLVSTTETETTYNEDYVGGYVFIGANDILVKDKEMFNKIKVLVHIPGVLRIGIVNEKIYEANPRYSTCLVKWLVADFVAFTGMKEYDIADTVLEEGQSIFLECRTGVSSWYLNTGESTQVGAITYPANSCTTGLRVTDKLDSTTNNILFKSQKVNSSSCLTSFGTNMYSIGGNIRGNFRERAYNSGASSSKKADENFEYFGGLNVGLYRRTKYSDTRVCKCIENAMNNSWVGDDNVTKIYASHGQERLVGKSVYAIKLDVRITGNLTIYHLKGKSLDTVQVIDKYTHYVRAIGLQTIHLPFDIKINSTDEYIGFGGFHCKSTSDNIVKHSCCWQYLDVSQATWMTTIDNNSKKFYSIGLSNTDYPEKFTSFESNNNYLNVELICRGEKRSPLEDKYISFTGDSITTYTGFCTTKNGYPEGNPAGDNAVYYPASGKVVNNVDATWWGILARDNRMKILRNDAWSGSRVSSSEGSTDTKCLCGANRRYYLRNGYNFATNSTYPFGRPEIVVSMIGTNDLSGNVELGSEMFRGVMGAEEEYKTILSAFSLFCRRIHDQEGNGGAKIVHFLIPRGSDYGYANANGVTIADLSLHFERIAKAWGQYFIPLSYFNGIKPNAPKRWSCPTGSMFKNTSGVEFPSADGLHPNVMGMEVIADGVHRFLCSIM